MSQLTAMHHVTRRKTIPPFPSICLSSMPIPTHVSSTFQLHLASFHECPFSYVKAANGETSGEVSDDGNWFEVDVGSKVQALEVGQGKMR